MLMHLSTWQEIESYLARSRGVIVPIGSTEQHGPTGLLGTDAICPEVIARRAAGEVEALVAPTISVGMAEHHMAFPGTITYRPSTLIEVVCDYVHSLARHGFCRMLFVNGHGGNVATVNAAFFQAYATADGRIGADAGGFRCRLANWWGDRDVKALSDELFGNRNGGHATASEISVTQFAHPDAIKRATLDPPVAPTGPIYDAADFRRRYPDGRMGSDPTLASPEHGGRLVEVAARAVARLYREFLAEA